MLCGLGVPSLRSLWGAVRNQQLYILRMYCKGWISFNFSIFFIIYTSYSKKKLHDLPQKLKNSIFFYNSHDLQQKKNYTHLQQKKITRLYGFFVHDLHFSLKAAAAILREPIRIITDTKGHHTLQQDDQFEDCDENEEEVVLLVGQFRRMKITVRNLDKTPKDM